MEKEDWKNQGGSQIN